MKQWKTIVVGVDGSDHSCRALAWAADEARDHGAALRVLSSWSAPPPAASVSYGSLPWSGALDFSDLAKARLDEALEAVLGPDPDLTVERVVVEGHAARRLVQASEDADLLVVGSRGHGEFPGLLLGSVSLHVVTHAPCPTVVVR